MKREGRFWAGWFTLILLLIPVVAVSAPGVLDGLQDWINQTDERLDDLEAAVFDTTTPSPPSTEPPATSTTTQGPGSTTTVDPTSTTTVTIPPTTTTVPSTTLPPGTTTSLPQNVITGSVCPSTVTGTAQLVGNVTLECDLAVTGTLIARPGVNLDGQGFQIIFTDGGKADFQGTPTFTWSGTGANANLARDIVFDDVRRIMFTDGAQTSILEYFAVTNSGTPTLGDYPIHFHLNGNNTAGTVVLGVVVENSLHHAFVAHGSHGITFKDTIAKTVRREAYWWDPGFANRSHNITYDHVLSDNAYWTRSLGDIGFWHRMSAFFLGQGDNNTVRNSVARNTVGGSDCSGFHWPEFDHDVWTFENNQAYGECHGIFVWQNDSLPHVIDGFTGGGVSHGAYVNEYVYNDLNVDYVENHALGRGDPVTYDGGSLGDVTMVNHQLQGAPVIFRNLTMDSFTVHNGGGQPGVYWLNNTNITCSDVQFRSVASGTRVVINGTDC